MKKIACSLLALIAVLVLSGCRRNYQVNYARVAVDSTALAAQANDSGVVQDAEEEAMGNYDDPLFQDAQFEGGVEDPAAARREYREFVTGGE